MTAIKEMKRIIKLFLLISLIKTSQCISCDRQLLPELTFRLSGHELSWPSGSTLSIYESSGRYVPRNLIATRLQIRGDEAYIALPRFKPGVPFSLGVVSVKSRPIGRATSSPIIRPFPDWDIQEEGNCTALQSVVDLLLDNRHVLWVLDTGIVNGLEQPVKRCPPKILGFDLRNRKQVMKRLDLEPFVDNYSRLQHLAIETGAGDRTFIYVSDGGQDSLLVYDLIENVGMKIKLPFEISQGSITRDVLYLASVKTAKESVLYLTYLGSNRLFSIATNALRRGEDFIDVAAKDNKIVILGTDGSNIFFRNKGQSDVYMWDTETQFKSDNFILVQKGNDCRLPTHVVSGSKKLMWMMESNFHDYIENTVSCSGPSILIHPLVKSCND